VEAIIFLSVDDVLLLHTDVIDIDGGSHGMRDHGLLDAVVAMPRQQFGGDYLHHDLAAIAAAYIFYIAKNHHFVDGNKRAMVLPALVFPSLSGAQRLPDPKR
jgi:death-on-curing protein